MLDLHQDIDGLLEKEKAKTKSSLGTTKKGIGPTYEAKCGRTGIRVCDLYVSPDCLREKLVPVPVCVCAPILVHVGVLMCVVRAKLQNFGVKIFCGARTNFCKK